MMWGKIHSWGVGVRSDPGPESGSLRFFTANFEPESGRFTYAFVCVCHTHKLQLVHQKSKAAST